MSRRHPLTRSLLMLYCALLISGFGGPPVTAATTSDAESCIPTPLCDGLSWLLAIRARLWMQLSDFDAAYADLNAAITLNETNPALYVLRGQVQLARYEWDASAGDYALALRINPDYADAYFYRGVLRYSILQTGLSLREDALADFRRYLELAPAGQHAQAAARYQDSIQRELDALTND